MKAGVLYSGGKDSTLAAVLLSRDYEVELITFVFDPTRTLPFIEAAAKAAGFPWKKQAFAPGFLDDVISRIVTDGHPANAINEIHRRSLYALAQEYEVVADGARRDDRVPMRTQSEVQSFEMMYGVSYMRPLLGIGKKEVLRLCERSFDIACGETGSLPNGDFESEIRAEMVRRGIDFVPLFPKNHKQSLIIRKKLAINYEQTYQKP
ncbi:MAG: alpha hydrolase [Methanocalculaceae archaeon]|jgi:predicted subunit of tRNA(5-methylaminomethyl-2-thiouridylate) methyltransferase|nr:alpha hydrolase [Methanocalculaceae archaeon]